MGHKGPIYKAWVHQYRTSSNPLQISQSIHTHLEMLGEISLQIANKRNSFMFSVTSVCITAFLTVILHGQVPPALAGLALAYAAHISGVFHYTVRLMSDTEVRFISVERMNLYHEVNNTIVSALTDSSVTCAEIAAERLSFSVLVLFCYIKFCIQLCNHQNTSNIGGLEL